jgi:hypothetical protein
MGVFFATPPMIPSPDISSRLGSDFRFVLRTPTLRAGSQFRILDVGFFSTIDDMELNISDFAICFLVRISSSANFHSAFRNPHSAIVNPVARLSSRSRDDNS